MGCVQADGAFASVRDLCRGQKLGMHQFIASEVSSHIRGTDAHVGCFQEQAQAMLVENFRWPAKSLQITALGAGLAKTED